MDIKELKNYIYENSFVEQILNSINCHHIKYHATGSYWTCGNPDGDNNSAIVIYNNETLFCKNYTRNISNSKSNTDLIDLVCFFLNNSLFEGIKYICGEIGMSYYHDFDDDIPYSFKILNLLQDLNSNSNEEKDIPLNPINENILNYYKPYVNDLFLEDGIDYATQIEFEVGYDEESNRYTIPIRSEIGDLIGVKGRYFYRNVPENENKYIYLEPCSKSKILYGLWKTYEYIKRAGKVYIVEAEKGVMQLWSYGYKNTVSTCGKKISNYQIQLLVRLGVDIIFSFDKDVTYEEIELISNQFPLNIPIYYIYDVNNILSEKESPSDNIDKWRCLSSKIFKVIREKVS